MKLYCMFLNFMMKIFINRDCNSCKVRQKCMKYMFGDKNK